LPPSGGPAAARPGSWVDTLPGALSGLPPAAPPAPAGAGARPGLYQDGGKRLLDLLLVLLAAPLVLALLLPLALAVACDGAGPFYSQLRVGRHGRLYRLWKLRSMVPGADQALAALLARDAAARAEWARDQKLRHDPRITRFGGLLRRSSLDELPQLWNVLRGEMSLVGPRPMLPEQRPLYPGTAYYSLRPGLTGPWQVSARNGSAFAARARFDSRYARSLSLGGDLRLLLATLGVVCRGTGR
jgi:lipopolysaccharide/colanic/teichoic acid biosynthesis glycosyltransferase